jgi:uncharacterized membrane protein
MNLKKIKKTYAVIGTIICIIFFFILVFVPQIEQILGITPEIRLVIGVMFAIVSCISLTKAEYKAKKTRDDDN